MCSIHARLRTMMNVTKNDEGEWICNKGSKCQIGSGNSLRVRTDMSRAICSVHQRMRTLANLSKNENDVWVCNKETSCKVAEGKTKSKKTKASSNASSSILMNQRYKDGNFRGALQEYLKTGVLKYDKVEERERDGDGDDTVVFLSKCRIEGSEDASDMEGLGYGSNKKQAIQFAALDLMIKLELLTPKQHLEVHPETLK